MRLAAGALLALTLAAPAGAGAPSTDEAWVFASAQNAGVIDLLARGPSGSRLRYYERVGSRRVLLAERSIAAGDVYDRFLRATTWRCTRRERVFELDIASPDGRSFTDVSSVRTPPCSDRFALDVPRRVRRGTLARVVIRDAWRLGDVRPVLCVRPPGDPARCRRADFRGRATVVRIVRLAARGRWRLELRLGAVRERATIAAGVPAVAEPRLPALLVTGDSMVQNVDTALAERVAGRLRVVRGWRGGSRVGGPDPVWPGAAAPIARRVRPSETVISLGTSEGYPIGSTACCAADWRAAYARAVRRIAEAFTAGGRRVTWLLLPAMRDPRRQQMADIVNSATGTGLNGVARARLVHVERVLSPNGYTDTLPVCGREQTVRERDGIHIAPAGAALVADAILGIASGCPA